MNQWIVFMLSIGFLLILMSTTVEGGIGILVTGVMLVILSLFLLYRKKGNHDGN